MMDDQHDDMLRDLAAEYNAPPPTPREELWSRIQAARANPADEPRVLPFRPRAGWTGTPLARALTWATGVAALLAAGIGIGRLFPGDAPVAVPTIGATADPAPDRVANVMGMAVRQYLSRTETLLVGVRSGDDESVFAGHARELLGMTRLLLDSEALEDPATRALLEDLELVLAQLVVLPSTSNPDQERSLITASLADRNVMDRLRTAIPSPLGSAPAVYGEL